MKADAGGLALDSHRGRLLASSDRGPRPRPVDWVIELDECATDPLEAARESLAYLEPLRVHSR